jgi:hypothetical protein
MDPIDHAITWDGYREGVEHGVKAKRTLQDWGQLKGLPPGDYGVAEDSPLGTAMHRGLERDIADTLGKKLEEMARQWEIKVQELQLANDDVIAKQRELIGALGAISSIQDAVMRAPDQFIEATLRSHILTAIENRDRD